MNTPIYKSGEIVRCADAESLHPNLLVGSINEWRNEDVDSSGNRLYTYRVVGINKRGGEITTVNLFENQLSRE